MKLKVFKLFLYTLFHQIRLQAVSKIEFILKGRAFAQLMTTQEWAPGFESNSARRVSKRFCVTAAFLERFLGSFSDYLRDNTHMFLKQISHITSVKHSVLVVYFCCC